MPFAVTDDSAGLEGRALKRGGLFLSLKIEWNLHSQTLNQLGACHLFLSSFSFLE